jgi:hypothetical protein
LYCADKKYAFSYRSTKILWEIKYYQRIEDTADAHLIWCLMGRENMWGSRVLISKEIDFI